MNKKLIVVAIAAALAVPMVADAGAIMYGKVRVSTQNAERDNTGFIAGVPNVDSWGMADQSSRLGVKGDEDLGGGLKAIYKMEFGVNVGGGTEDKNPGGPGGTNNTWTQRNMYVGIAGDFGTFLMGRHDTPLKMSTMDLDFFADTNVDNDDTNSFGQDYSARGVGLFDSLRVDGAIAYVSPSFNGLTFMGAVVQHNAGADFGWPTDAGNHAQAGEEAFAGAYSLASMYKNGPWFASVAFESIAPDNLAGDIGSLPDYEKVRFGLGVLDFNNFSASFIYESRSQTSDTLGTFVDSDSWQLSAAYDLMGYMRVKAMYGQNDNQVGIFPGNTGSIMDTWAIGLEQNLSKRTDMQIIYRQKSIDYSTVGGAADFVTRDNVFAVQLDHSF